MTPTHPAFMVQTFKKVPGGTIVPGAIERVPTLGGAIKKAGALAARYLGTAALAVTLDPDTGDVISGKIVAAFGKIPEDFAGSLRGD